MPIFGSFGGMGVVLDVAKDSQKRCGKNEIVCLDVVKDVVFNLKNRGYNPNKIPIYSRKSAEMGAIRWGKY